jgi:hypothetical protein
LKTPLNILSLLSDFPRSMLSPTVSSHASTTPFDYAKCSNLH